MKKILLCALMAVYGLFTLQAEVTLSRGADISWCTEMEASGKKFYNKSGAETDIFALMKEIGMTSIRLRVWVNPSKFGYGSWCDKADVVAKAKRAQAQGLDLMIDFHYSDFFADPGTQTVPLDWTGYTLAQLKTAVAEHTKDVLQALKDEGIEPKWVQVGNETNNGILWETGHIDWSTYGTARYTNYVALSNAGYEAVKEVFPNAPVVVHIGGTESVDWFYKEFKAAGGKFDVIGLSHYPTEAQWNSEASDAKYSNIYAENKIKAAVTQYGVPVVISETGFDVSKPARAAQVMKDLFSRMNNIPKCQGIFYWEPETDGQWKPDYYTSQGWGAYGMGAFDKQGKPTIALDAFSGISYDPDAYPSSLKIYDKQGSNLLATLTPKSNEEGVYEGEMNVTEAWQNFYIIDEEHNVWYGCDPSDKTALSSDDSKWNLWIDSSETGIYVVEANLATKKWTHAYKSGIESIVVTPAAKNAARYNVMGQKVDDNYKGIVIEDGKKLLVK